MNSSPLLQLVWKEYRAARAFWFSLVVMVMAAQGLLLWLSDDSAWAVRMVCSLALAAPAFFALGCAGAAFAVEQEEGTFGFLQAAPISSRQVFASKMALTATATICMFLLLWPLALAFTGGELPQRETLGGMLGLWIMAAVEALAWGTLFSLLSARPLVAICLALLTTSTVVHLSAWSTLRPGEVDFSFAPYLRAVPLRAWLVSAVLAADVYLGSQWLRGGVAHSRRTRLRTRDSQTREMIETGDDHEKALSSAARSERGTMLAHLLWQQWRQSGSMMCTMATLQIGLAILWVASGVSVADSAFVPVVVVAGLAGSCVFLADQERQNYRYFVEHNVPPRLVWFTRQLPWLVVFLLTTLAAAVVWIGPGRLGELSKLVDSASHVENYWQWRRGQPSYIELPQVRFGLTCVAVAYAAGQWASMMVRSGLMACFVGLVLTGALCGWVYLMLLLQMSWLWTVLPIPLLLLGATWLRAPDWIGENTTWAARVRAGAVLIVPALVLVVAVPAFRVGGIPLVDPDYDSAEYQSGVTPEALATAELYRRANELYVVAPHAVSNPAGIGDEKNRPLTAGQLEWLKENAEPLALLLEASRRPTCCLYDPARTSDPPILRNQDGLLRLILASGRQLQAEGKLELALDRYFAALAAISHWTELAPYYLGEYAVREAAYVFDGLVRWSTAPGQTAEQVHAAIERLQGVDWEILHLDDSIKSADIVARRFVEGDAAAAAALFGDDQYESRLATRLYWDRLLPWEKYRELRKLNVATRHALAELSFLEMQLRDGRGIVHESTPIDSSWNEFPPFFASGQMMETSNALSRVLALFEANRRAALLRMALVGYRIEHGKLPPTLEELCDGFFKQLPHDPYSGVDYLYFPDGIPQPTTELERDDFDRARSTIIPGKPCVWCTSERVAARLGLRDNEDDESKARTSYVYYVDQQPYGYPTRLPKYTAWASGLWFPIPAQQE